MKNQALNPFIITVLFHLAAVVMVAATTVPLFLLREYLSASTLSLLYLIPVLMSTTLLGLSPGLLAGFFAFLAFNYFFLVPYYTFVVNETQDFFALVIFFFVAALISQLVGRAKRNLAAAEAREEEMAQLYELNRALASVTGVDEILQELADQTLATFRGEYVQVEAASEEQGERSDSLPAPITAQAGVPISSFSPQVVVPLHTARGKLGEIRLWRPKSLLHVEELMLQTFAAQGALAVERGQLAQAKTRAHVLEESDRLKSVLLSSVSHELRTPLATIKAAVTSLLEKNVVWKPEARDDLMAVIDEESDHLNHLVGNLLDMTRIEAGALQPNKQWNILSEIIHRVVTLLHRSLGDHKVVVEAPDHLPLAPVDDVQMEQVFHNLFSNSIKYAPPGSTINVRVWADGRENMHVQVTNQGPAVPLEHLDNIFDKFYRVQYAEKVSGTGLGLSICKGIIEAHGGKIWAENQPEGFAFRFSIPLTMDGALPPIVKSEG